MNRRNRNNYLSLAAVRAIGLDFIEMLEETSRRSITDRNKLKDIYNEEFRDRDGRLKDPNFSRVIYALRSGNKARLSRGRVYFNTDVRVRAHDQWFRPCRGQQTQASPVLGNASSLTRSSGQEPSRPGPEDGVRGRRKLAKEILQRLNTTDRSHFIADKCGVRVSSELYMENGKIQICVDQADVYELKLFVENTGQEAVYFTFYTALYWIQYFTLEDSKRVTRNNPLCLEPSEKYEVTVRFKSSHVGVYLATLAFEFKQNTQPTTHCFHIVRFIEAEYRTKLAAQLGPTEPYKPLRLNISEPEQCKVDEGFPPEGYVQNFLENVLPLGQYTPPPDIPRLAKHSSSQTLRGTFQDLQFVSFE